MSDVDPKVIAQQTAARYGPKASEVHRHYKGGYYVVLASAVIEATLEPCVVYRSLKYGRVWVRTLVDWQQTVKVDGEKVPRFTKVADDYAVWDPNVTEAKP